MEYGDDMIGARSVLCEVGDLVPGELDDARPREAPKGDLPQFGCDFEHVEGQAARPGEEKPQGPQRRHTALDSREVLADLLADGQADALPALRVLRQHRDNFVVQGRRLHLREAKCDGGVA